MGISKRFASEEFVNSEIEYVKSTKMSIENPICQYRLSIYPIEDGSDNAEIQPQIRFNNTFPVDDNYDSRIRADLYMNFEGASGYNFDHNVLAKYVVASGDKRVYNDGHAGCLMGSTGIFFMQGTEDTDPQIRFLENDSTEYNTRVYTSGDVMYFEGATGYKFDENIKTTRGVYTGGKESISDGLSGCVLNTLGSAILQGNADNNPSILFLSEGSTSYDARIHLDTSDILNFTEATQYKFDNIIVSNKWVYSNGKTAYNDGKGGCALIDGFLAVQPTDTNDTCGIHFYQKGSTSYDARIVLSNNEMWYGGKNNANLSLHKFYGAMQTNSTISADDRIYAINGITTGNKTTYTDGKAGVFAAASGNLYIQNTSKSSVIFYVGSTTTENARIGVNTSDVMEFTGASSYTFDNTIKVSGTAVSLNGHTHASITSDDGTGRTVLGASSLADVAYTFRPNQQSSTDYHYYLGSTNYRWRTLYSVNAVNVSSDYNMKENIETVPQKYIDMLDEIKPVIYKFKTGDRLHGGYISQWVEEAMNRNNITAEEFGGFCKDVKIDNDGNIVDGEYEYSLRYTEFLPILHAKVKQIEEKYNDKLEQMNLKIAELEAKLK